MAAGSFGLSRIPIAAKVGIGVGLVALVTIAYFTIFYNDVASAIRSAETKEGLLKKELDDAKLIAEAYQRDLIERNKLEEQAKAFNKMLPDTASYPAFLSDVQGVATACGVSLIAWSPLEESVQEFYAKVPMQLKLTGRFHQVAKFFNNVGQLDRIINIEDIEIGKPKAVDDDVTVEVDCLATAFRSIPPELAATIRDKQKAGGGKKQK